MGGRLIGTSLSTATPEPFDFVATACSHGWAVLDPNRWDRAALQLERTERLGPGRVVTFAVRGGGSRERPRLRIDVCHAGDLSSEECARVRSVVRWMLRLDEDLGEFHAHARGLGGRWKKVAEGRGRLLRSPTVFEDAVKTICTTNVQWGGTKAMVRGLVETLGEPGPAPDGGVRKAFPTPEAIADAHPRQIDAARLGYRARYVRDLAERVVAKELDLEGLRDPSIPLAELERNLLDLKGVGPYAAATLLMLLGRYDHLAVDSVFRGFVTERYFDGTQPTEAQARAIYDSWGRWKYLGYWFDMSQGPVTVEDL